MTNEEDRTTVGHCKADSTDTYIGRGPNNANLLNTPVGNRGWLGNPYKLEDGYSRGDSIEKFRADFYKRLDDPEFREAVHGLAGETLGGWCQREDDETPACHGEVIAEYLNERGDAE